MVCSLQKMRSSGVLVHCGRCLLRDTWLQSHSRVRSRKAAPHNASEKASVKKTGGPAQTCGVRKQEVKTLLAALFLIHPSMITFNTMPAGKAESYFKIPGPFAERTGIKAT